MTQPDRSEIIPKDELPQRMKGLRAVFIPQHSNASRHAYWVRAHGMFAIVKTYDGARVRIDYYKKASDCGCG